LVIARPTCRRARSAICVRSTRIAFSDDAEFISASALRIGGALHATQRRIARLTVVAAVVATKQTDRRTTGAAAAAACHYESDKRHDDRNRRNSSHRRLPFVKLLSGTVTT
jgi:hypothetical protein